MGIDALTIGLAATVGVLALLLMLVALRHVRRRAKDSLRRTSSRTTTSKEGNAMDALSASASRKSPPVEDGAADSAEQGNAGRAAVDHDTSP